MRIWRGGLLAVLTILGLVAGLTPSAADRLTPRIVGGQDSPIELVPYQVALIRPGSGSDANGQFCGGSIIAELWVVTAAHCVVTKPDLLDRPEDVLVLAGKATLSSSRDGSGPYTAVSRIIVHPDYNSQTQASDLALLRLSTPLPLNGSTIAPIALPTAQDPSTWPVAGTRALISGWGKVAYTNPNGATRLQSTEIDVLAGPQSDICGPYTSEYQKAYMLCAGLLAGGRDTCQGDSGGPLRITVGDRPVLAGVTSVGDLQCARPDRPGLYTRVTTYTSWITDHLKATEGLTLSPSGLDFGAPEVGTITAAQSVTLSNIGSTTLDVSPTLSGANAAEFRLGNACGPQLPGGASCTVSIAFAPAAGGEKYASLRVDPDGAQIPLVGAGTTVTVLPSVTVPGQPAGLATKAGRRKVTVRWNGVPSATSYTVKLRGRPAKGKKRAFVKTAHTTAPNVVFRKALRKPSAFRVCVSAQNAAGVSPQACLRAKRK